MSTHDRSGTTARRALWFGGLLLLLAGIVGMHGLNSHTGGMAPDVHLAALHEAATAPMSAAQMSAAPPSAAREAIDEAVHDVAGAATEFGAAVGHGIPDGHMGLAAMCMAVLAMALLVLLRMMGGAPPLSLDRRVVALARVPEAHGRDPDPPSLTVLSIRRC